MKSLAIIAMSFSIGLILSGMILAASSMFDNNFEMNGDFILYRLIPACVVIVSIILGALNKYGVL